MLPKPLLADVRPYSFAEIPTVILDAFRGRRIIAIADTANDPRFEGSAIRAANARAVIAVPVFLKDRVFGCQQGGQEKGRFCSTGSGLTFVPGEALADEFAQSCR